MYVFYLMPFNKLTAHYLQDITDTTEFNKDGILLPLGGREETCKLAPPPSACC